MPSKLKYRGHKARKPKPKVIDTKGMVVIPPPDKSNNKHPNFREGGIYFER